MSEKNFSPNGSFSKNSASPAVSHDEGLQINHDYSTPDRTPYSEHGPGIDHKIPQEDVVQEGRGLLWSRIRHTMREPFSEFLGVFILILFGDGVVAQVDQTYLVTERY